MLKAGQEGLVATDSKCVLVPSLPSGPVGAVGRPEGVMPPKVAPKQTHSLTCEALDNLERRHEKLMTDIARLGARLTEISVSVGGGA